MLKCYFLREWFGIMEDIEKLFIQEDSTFTVYVVEQQFVVNRGADYFKKYRNTSSYITSKKQIKNVFSKAIQAISKNVAPVEKLVNMLCSGFSGISIADAITSLCQLFTVNEHQLAGPDVIDPIILQEGDITKRDIARIISLNKDSILRPTVILLLKDNNFERAMELLAECPDGINIKMIRNSGKEEKCKVVNCGADNIVSFIDSFAKQCYSTCSNTPCSLLLNSDWSENFVVKKYSPMIFKFRSNLLFDQKEEVAQQLTSFTDEIINLRSEDDEDEKIFRSFECIMRLFRVFCNDSGGNDILAALKIARELNHELLLAQVYRYADFLPNCSMQDRIDLYSKGYFIFKRNMMNDNAIYCKNNMLIEQFYTNSIHPEEFREMQIEAVNNVPGMVALSHIYNNVGVAYLYCGQTEIAVDFFERGLEYARNNDRIVQNLAIESNKMIAENYSYITIDDNRIRLLMRRIFDGMGTTKLPFLAADYALNVLAVALKQNKDLGKELIETYPIKNLINISFSKNAMNAGERYLQIQFLCTHFSAECSSFMDCKLPNKLTASYGKRAEFIINYGLNPFDFEIWL